MEPLEVADQASLNRTGSRISKCVDEAIERMVQYGVLAKTGEHIAIPGASVYIRSREEVQSAGLRKPELLPPAEIEKAVIAVVQINHGIEPQELFKEVSLLFGFKSAREKLRSTIQRIVDNMVATGLVEKRNERLYINVAAVQTAQPTC